MSSRMDWILLGALATAYACTSQFLLRDSTSWFGSVVFHCFASEGWVAHPHHHQLLHQECQELPRHHHRHPVGRWFLWLAMETLRHHQHRHQLPIRVCIAGPNQQDCISLSFIKMWRWVTTLITMKNLDIIWWSPTYIVNYFDIPPTETPSFISYSHCCLLPGRRAARTPTAPVVQASTMKGSYLKDKQTLLSKLSPLQFNALVLRGMSENDVNDTWLTNQYVVQWRISYIQFRPHEWNWKGFKKKGKVSTAFSLSQILLLFQPEKSWKDKDCIGKITGECDSAQLISKKRALSESMVLDQGCNGQTNFEFWCLASANQGEKLEDALLSEGLRRLEAGEIPPSNSATIITWISIVTWTKINLWIL